MKIILPLAIILLAATSAWGMVSDDAVLDIKIPVAELQATGSGPEDFELHAAQLRVDALSAAIPAEPPAVYADHVQSRLKEAEQQDADFSKAGFTDEHPKRRAIAAKIKFLQQELQRAEH